MKEQWIKNIHNKLADYERSAPDGLWEEIELSLESRNNSKVLYRRIFQWSVGMVGVAAVLAVAFFVDGRDTNVTANVKSYEQLVSKTDYYKSDEILLDAVVQKSCGEENSVCPEESLPLQVLPNAAIVNDTFSVHSTDIVNYRLVAKSSDNKHTDNQNSVVIRRSSNTSSSNVSKYKNAISHNKSNTEGRLGVSLFAANLIGSEKKQNGYGALVVRANLARVPYSLDGSIYDPVTEILLCNHDKDVYVKTKHKQPIKIGFAVQYSLSDRVSVGSGLTYSYLTSQLTSGSDAHRYETEQSLQYIGIPLSVDYSLWRNKLLTWYVSCGGMVEKCVDGKSETAYVINNKIESTAKEDTKVNPLQFSLNAATGVQLNISSRFGIYAEPGVSYYFDNGSPVETIYKKKPFNFNLEMGIRYSF